MTAEPLGVPGLPPARLLTAAEYARLGETGWGYVDRDGGLLGAGDVRVVVEIVSPGSGRLDYVTKRGEYADAGIPHYWIVDLDKPVSLLDCHLAGDFGYADSGALTGVFTASVPFPVRLELDLLA